MKRIQQKYDMSFYSKTLAICLQFDFSEEKQMLYSRNSPANKEAEI